MKNKIATLLCLTAAGMAQSATVDTELVLLVDVSGSVNDLEYSLQKDGYVNAFTSQPVLDAIASVGSIAVTYVEWSGRNQQAQLVDWTFIDSASTAQSFANSIGQTDRSFYNMTAPGSAIDYATGLFGTETGFTDNGFQSNNQVIDISGDGLRNSGSDVSNSASDALAAGVDQINGLPIGNATVANFYADEIVSGENSFFMAAYQFADINDSLVKKLSGEITGTVPVDANIVPPAAPPPADIPQVPVPGALIMFASGILALGGVNYKKHKM